MRDAASAGHGSSRVRGTPTLTDRAASSGLLRWESLPLLDGRTGHPQAVEKAANHQPSSRPFFDSLLAPAVCLRAHMRTLVWFRGKDLRLTDHAALVSASARSRELLCVFVLQGKHFEAGERARAEHRLQCLLGALQSLARELEARGNRLFVVRGPAAIALPALVAQFRIDGVYAMRSVEPGARRIEAHVAAALRIPFELCEGETLAPPGSVRTRSGSPFRVFTAFASAFRSQVRVGEALPLPARLPPPPAAPHGAGHATHGPGLSQDIGVDIGRALPRMEDLGIRPNPNLAPTDERAANARMARFFARNAAHYPALRDRMDLGATSRLSTDLHFGTLSVRTLWNAAHAALPPGGAALQRFSSQLLWREFAHHTLFDRPELLREPFRSDFAGFPFRDDRDGWDAWTAGMTGYPVVDAAARQLLREGFVHNRARMIAASFLSKHLLLHYAQGEAHYLRHLSDGDLAQNNLGWQWSAGTGCDAQPYFRVFNPVKQGERFDPAGDYVRRYVPELAALDARHIHAPWLAPSEVLQQAGVRLGHSYPRPIVEHSAARQRFLLLAGTRHERAVP